VTDEADKSIKSMAASWVAGQPFNNVLLIAIFAAIAWFGHYELTTARPANLKQIQDGYQSLTEAHREERKELRETYGQWMKKEAAASHAGRATAAVE